jgi:hypothetical protein
MILKSEQMKTKKCAVSGYFAASLQKSIKYQCIIGKPSQGPMISGTEFISAFLVFLVLMVQPGFSKCDT